MKNPLPELKVKLTGLKRKIPEFQERILSLKSDKRKVMLYVGSAFVLLVLLFSIFLGIKSCTCSDDYDFKNSEDAVSRYRSYLNELRNKQKTDANTFCNDINHWQEMRDTVINYLARDTTINRHIPLVYSYYDITDSIKVEFGRLTGTWKCSFNDVIRIKEGTTPFRNDDEIIKASQQASRFFHMLDSVQPPKVSKEFAISQYRDFLIDMEHAGINDTLQLKKFLIKEDIYFRTFLAHLYEFDGERISDITQSTQRLCHSIYMDAREGKMDKKMVVTYMSMRTVRRLLQNSTVCVNDISHKRMRSDIQANAYLWMIIQPFISIDQMAIAMITPEGRENLTYIAEQLPKSTSFARAFNIDQRSLSYLLPQQLLKMYVLTL